MKKRCCNPFHNPAHKKEKKVSAHSIRRIAQTLVVSSRTIGVELNINQYLCVPCRKLINQRVIHRQQSERKQQKREQHEREQQKQQERMEQVRLEQERLAEYRIQKNQRSQEREQEQQQEIEHMEFGGGDEYVSAEKKYPSPEIH